MITNHDANDTARNRQEGVVRKDMQMQVRKAMQMIRTDITLVKKREGKKNAPRSEASSGAAAAFAPGRIGNKTKQVKRKRKKESFNNINVVPSTNLLYIHRTP